MIKMMSQRAMYHTMGKKNFLEYILFGVFVFVLLLSVVVFVVMFVDVLASGISFSKFGSNVKLSLNIF